MNHTKKQDNSENNFDKDEFEQFFDEMCKQSDISDENAKKNNKNKKTKCNKIFFKLKPF